MEQIKGGLEAGILEIYRYVPPALLEKPVEEMGLDEYLCFLAKARYLEEVESNLFLMALGRLFGE